MSELLQRVQVLEREQARLLLLLTARQPVAIAGQSQSYDITFNASPFALGDVVKCVGGVWQYTTSADTGPLILGVVSAVTATSCTITVGGLRLATGTVGDQFWIPDAAGNAAAAPSVAGWWRIVELQVTPSLRLVRPDVLGFMPLTVSTCDSGTPATHIFPAFSPS